jgi:hypothetical protein
MALSIDAKRMQGRKRGMRRIRGCERMERDEEKLS